MEIEKAISVLQNSRFWDYTESAPEEVTHEFCDAVNVAVAAMNCIIQASFILVSWNTGECEPVLRRFSSSASALSTIHDEIDEIANEQYMTQEEKEECVIQDTWNSVFLEGFDGKTYYWWVVDEASIDRL